MQPQSNLIQFRDRREHRRQRIAREMLRWPIWQREMPDTVAAAYVRKGSSYDFLASSRLDDVDLKLAAYACAVKTERGDAVEGVHFATLDAIRMITERRASFIGEALRPFVDTMYLGLPATAGR